MTTDNATINERNHLDSCFAFLKPLLETFKSIYILKDYLTHHECINSHIASVQVYILTS